MLTDTLHIGFRHFSRNVSVDVFSLRSVFPDTQWQWVRFTVHARAGVSAFSSVGLGRLIPIATS